MLRYKSCTLIFPGPSVMQSFYVIRIHSLMWVEGRKLGLRLLLLLLDCVFFLTSLQIHSVKEPSFFKFSKRRHQCVQCISIFSPFSLFYCSWPNKFGEGWWEEPIFKMPVATSSSDSSKCFGPATLRFSVCLCLCESDTMREKEEGTLKAWRLFPGSGLVSHLPSCNVN